ncbi:MAG TPA: sodium ion-translocating decarboxylase subunit beta [Feifaniaceae bacterium]|nr:sodium ion-translocating decarboxylase subunit beta [Feifaniaceae bacterium]
MSGISNLFQGILAFHWEYLVMYAIGGLLIYLAIAKDYEPLLLLPIGFGAILVNIPLSVVWPVLETDMAGHGLLQTINDFGIATELFPALIFIGIGAMTDFRPLFATPKMMFFGAAAQFGIFLTVMAAIALSQIAPNLFPFSLKDAASIGIIGAADGPTSIMVANAFSPHLLGPISVAAYSYMSLVPIIQPPVIKLLTTKEERKIRMKYSDVVIPKWIMVLFPIGVTILAGILAPISVPLIGLLMFGNLLKEAGVVERLSQAAQKELSNIVTLLLGITIGASMHFSKFLTIETIGILVLGFFAFVFDTAGGVLFAKLLNLFSKEKVNPMVGAAGISAFPMAARIVQRMAKDEDPTNFVLMQAMGANVSGQIGSVIAGGIILSITPWLSTLIK